jgi:hypothetical protein
MHEIVWNLGMILIGTGALTLLGAFGVVAYLLADG